MKVLYDLSISGFYMRLLYEGSIWGFLSKGSIGLLMRAYQLAWKGGQVAQSPRVLTWAIMLKETTGGSLGYI